MNVTTRFMCEIHDVPGDCDSACLELISGMSPLRSTDFDETGTTYTEADDVREEYVLMLGGVFLVTAVEATEENLRAAAARVGH